MIRKEIDSFNFYEIKTIEDIDKVDIWGGFEKYRDWSNIYQHRQV